MQIKKIDKPTLDIARQVGELHFRALGQYGFLAKLGPTFLKHFYYQLVRSGNAQLICALEGEVVRGFVVGCDDPARIQSMLATRFYFFGPLILALTAYRPSLLWKILQAPLYEKKVKTTIRPELFAIAVDSSGRSQGIGASLVEKLDEEFRSRSVREYKVSVYEELNRSNSFYLKRGFVFLETIVLYDTPINLYSKTTANHT